MNLLNNVPITAEIINRRRLKANIFSSLTDILSDELMGRYIGTKLVKK
ncbi:hypothetical protein P7H96_12375 [Lactococcus lactis]|nr:hypothetical protein [Lactococcus lactis]MDT2912183.1 hypothetical protein [Lactococcus lactis]